MNPIIEIKVLLVDRFEHPKEWKLEIPSQTSAHAAAEFVFEISNAPPQFLCPAKLDVLEKFPRTGLRSVSVGDVLIISDPERPGFRHVATVERNGFRFH